MIAPTFYEILGVLPNASFAEIHAAYRKLALEYHPDRHSLQKDAAFYATQFRLIHDVYETLSDPIQRRQYDEYLGNLRAASAHQGSSETFAKRNSANFNSVYNEKVSDFDRDNNNRSEFDFNRGKQQPPNSTFQGYETHDGGATWHPKQSSQPVGTKRTSNNKKAGIAVAMFLLLLLIVPALFSKKETPYAYNGSADTIPAPKPDTSYEIGRSAPTPEPITSPPVIDTYANWKKVSLGTGQEPPMCSNIVPDYDLHLDNYLNITVMNNQYDAIVKLINAQTKLCIRAVFISAGESYTMKNIPEGIYYVKEAYGTDLRRWSENGECKLRFIYDAIYKEFNKSFDFRRQYDSDSTYLLPSYTLHLGVLSPISDTGELTGTQIGQDDFDQ